MIISLTGGLGNQLFQYFAGLYFCKDADTLLVTSEFGVPRRTGAVSDLEFFYLHQATKIIKLPTSGRVTKKIANLALTRNLASQTNAFNQAKSRTLDSLLSTYFSMVLRRRVSVFSSDAVGYTSRVPTDDSLIFGYFQSYKYFDSLPPNKRELTLKRESTEFLRLKEKMIHDKPLVVHVRLGDYLKENHFGVLTKEYYSKGIELFEKEYGEAKIWLFSDEPAKALEMLPKQKDGKYFVVPNNSLNPAETLELMRYGSRYLIANSSFSWWGATLSYFETPRVIAPLKWFNGMEDPHELIPKNWELLDR